MYEYFKKYYDIKESIKISLNREYNTETLDDNLQKILKWNIDNLYL